MAFAQQMIMEGRQTFRFDTFGDEEFWGDQLHLHDAIKGAALGGVGPGLTPNAALGLGLRVDSEALNAATRQQIQNGTADLGNPATTVELLRQNAVIGVTGFFDVGGALTKVGIQCALCHSTVDDDLAVGIGRRRDGWPNRDLNVGAIIALAPDLTPFTTLLGASDPAVRAVLNSWGPGKFDAELVLDGQAMQPGSSTSSATLIPPAYGLAGVNLGTWTGWGSTTHWNGLVANIEMHGKGTFWDPRLNDANKFPIAAAAGFANIRNTPDLITPKLAALHFYQLSLRAPTPPTGSFDATMASNGKIVFETQAQCARCHVPPLFTEPGWNMHLPADVGIDGFQASRSPDAHYRTPPLKGLWAHQTGGFYHDGRFATLDAVVNHYDGFLALGLTPTQKAELVQYLLSL
ncbi:MAG TPA: hypothetical protein VEI02_16645 [Planctomycetota bacterium]|nr:hypothetical protein [Planctomycetota bacterium]